MMNPTTQTQARSLHGHGEVLFHKPGMKVSQLLLPAGANLPKHIVADDLVVVVVRGTGMFDIEGEVRTVTRGDVFEVNAGELHSVEAYEDIELVFVQVALGGTKH